jgi:methylated-DNA-[protein]-cysteine S-methyltransferase
MGSLTIQTPIGAMTLSARGGRLAALTWTGEGETDLPAPADAGLLAEAARQLEAWFAGRRRGFDLPLAPPATPFGGSVRRAMLDIPYGATASYTDVARRIGSAPRAVGTACGRNPLPIIVPCHRVVAEGGTIGGYSGGLGLPTKRWLLAHEKRG